MFIAPLIGPKVLTRLNWRQGAVSGSAVMLVPAIWLMTGGFPVAPLANVPWLVLAQILASTCMFALYFRLQAVGGPVYLSQIGYVGAAVALLAGTLFLRETSMG